ncbi:hypothetical protein H0H81_003943 [Sphagnurus paluster]|uniref:Uncharacterized protein n=1 Tax=Sphagnurus paluster TaxID=117069 RepID=A0A9P7KH80_9AGAR|nr:hypothetical protein H0H81_003943 [Sphagnurus paluster]
MQNTPIFLPPTPQQSFLLQKQSTRSLSTNENQSPGPEIMSQSNTTRFCSQALTTPLQDRVNNMAMQAVMSKIVALELELAKECAEKDQLVADLAQAQEDAIMLGPDEQQQHEHKELWAKLEAIQHWSC